jgi:uncharacterized protein YceH (UPF0502 family)
MCCGSGLVRLPRLSGERSGDDEIEEKLAGACAALEVVAALPAADGGVNATAEKDAMVAEKDKRIAELEARLAAFGETPP